MIRSLLPISSVVLAGALVTPETRAQDSILLENLHVFDVESGEMRGPLDLAIEGGRIEALGSDAEGALRIDCSGKFAVPGLCECHAHLAMLTKQGDEHVARQLRAFSTHGVTHVRDVGGPVELLQSMSRRISTGEQIGPEIIYCGPMLEKSPLHWAMHNEEMPGFTVAIDTTDDVDRLLPELAAKGARLLKTFNNQDPAVYEHLVKKASELSLRIVHDPGSPLFHAMPIDRALELGVTSFEHAKAPWPVILKDELQEEHAEILARGVTGMGDMPFTMKVLGHGVDSISLEKLDRLCGSIREKGAYVCPTLRVFDSMLEEEPPEEVPEAMRETQQRAIASMNEVSRFLVAELAQRDVKLLVGHDGPAPEGILDEMELMAECGVSEVEILRGATLYPARWLGAAERIGSISPGKEANVLVVSGNPLEAIEHIRSTFLVIQKGEIVFRREEPGGAEDEGDAVDEPLPPGVVDLDLARILELYNLTDTLGDRLWPGFDTRRVPIALNIDDERELLIAHPTPPDHFAPLGGVTVGESVVMLRDGVTRFGPRGGGWAITLGGEETVYVCTMPAEGGSTESYLGLMLHEAFHVYQQEYRDRADGPRGETPTDDPIYSALLGLESRILAALASEPDEAQAQELARMFVAVRHERRRDLPEEVVRAEGEAEYSEGTATYVEARMLKLLTSGEVVRPVAETPDPHYRAFEEAEKMYAERLMRITPPPGQVITFFHAMYNLGMAQGLALDRLRPGWKEEMSEKGMTQFALLERTFPLTEERELELFALAEERFDFLTLLDEQERLVNERLDLIRGYIEAPGRRYRIHHDRIRGRFMWKPKGPVYDVPPSLLAEDVPGGASIWAGGMETFEKEGLKFVADGVPIIFRHDYLEWIDGEPAADGSDCVVHSERFEDGVHHGLRIEADGFLLEADRARIEQSEEVVDILPEPAG